MAGTPNASRKNRIGPVVAVAVIAFGIWDLVDHSVRWGLFCLAAGLGSLAYFMYVERRQSGDGS